MIRDARELPVRPPELTRRQLVGLGGAAAASLFIEGCGGGMAPAVAVTRNVVLLWNEQMLQAIRTTKPGPPIVARMLGIVSTCMYDAWSAYDAVAVGTRLSGTLRRPVSERTAANKQAAISYAAYRALVDLFPTREAAFDAQMAVLGYDPADLSTNTSTPVGIGNVAAAAILSFRHADGSNQLGDLHPGAYSDYTGYASVNTPDSLKDPNRWQPLRISNGQGGFTTQSYIAPHWGRVTPFALNPAAQFRPASTLPRAGSAEYTAQAQQIVDYSSSLTDTQKLIAEFFADGPNSELPPGHWYLFGRFVSERDRHDLDTDVRMFFALGNAVMDAGIACWDCKRTYDYVRPVSAVHYAFRGQAIRAWGGPFAGTISMPAERFLPYQPLTVVTPAFPEFCSGHSTYSAAGAEILKRFTGSDTLGFSVFFPKGSSRIEPGLVPAQPIALGLSTFSEAADMAGISRRYGGIHFATGDEAGRLLGRLVGGAVSDRAQSYVNGKV